MFVPICHLDPTLRDVRGFAHDPFGPIRDDLDLRPGGELDAGSIRTRDQLYDLLKPLIRRLSREYRDRLDPDDAAQEAWLELLTRIDRYSPPAVMSGGLTAWAWVVARRKLFRLAAASARRTTRALQSSEAPDPVDPRGGPPEAYERAEARLAVRSALAEARGHMAGASHVIMVLRWPDGRSVLEVAAILGITPAQVRNRQRRALPALRAALARQGNHPDLSTPRGPSSPNTGELTP